MPDAPLQSRRFASAPVGRERSTSAVSDFREARRRLEHDKPAVQSRLKICAVLEQRGHSGCGHSGVDVDEADLVDYGTRVVRVISIQRPDRDAAFFDAVLKTLKQGQ
jgi:hypothetical protein